MLLLLLLRCSLTSRGKAASHVAAEQSGAHAVCWCCQLPFARNYLVFPPSLFQPAEHHSQPHAAWARWRRGRFRRRLPALRQPLQVTFPQLLPQALWLQQA